MIEEKIIKEDVITTMVNGFGTYTTNLNLCIPFILNVIITGIFTIIMLVIGFTYILGSPISLLKNVTTPEQMILLISSLIIPHLPEIVVLVILIFLVSLFFDSFFMSGAIAMAYQATGTGKTELSTMTGSGKKNVLNMFLAEVFVSLLSLAGIIFIVPGAMKLDLDNIFSPWNTNAGMQFVAGLILWILYAIILNLVLLVFRYALVIDGLYPIESITTGFRFFNQNKGEVAALWVIIGVIMTALSIIEMVMGEIPVIKVLWPFVNFFINVLVIPPVTTLWWVRLYMIRTGKRIYFNDLLLHPNDLAAMGKS